MKHVAWGIVVGGAVAAAFAGAATANATPETWTPDYTVDNATLLAGPSSLNSPAWELPASFTSGTTTLTGTDYIAASAGGFDDEFVTKSGAVYDQDQLGGGFTNVYYDPSATGTAVDMMKTPFGTFNLSSMAALFTPHDFSKLGTAAEVGHNFAFNDATGTQTFEMLGLPGNGGAWSAEPVTGADVTPMLTKDGSLVWSVPASYQGDAGATVTGTEYVTSPGDVEFVDKAGDIYDQNMLSWGLFPVNNLYYDPVGGPAQDHLQTIFGTIDVSSIASWFAPTTDVADLTTPSPVADLADAGLYSALDLGAVTP